MKAERAWAYAMQLKDEMEDKPRKRFHHNRRLSKAVIYAAKVPLLLEH
jgi:signal recognition particle subunit SRP68